MIKKEEHHVLHTTFMIIINKIIVNNITDNKMKTNLNTFKCLTFIKVRLKEVSLLLQLFPHIHFSVTLLLIMAL